MQIQNAYEQLLDLFTAQDTQALRDMIEAEEYRSTIVRELAVLGPGIVRAINDAGIKVRSVGAGVRVSKISATMKKFGIQTPPGGAGLFVPFDRALYIIEDMDGVSVHEAGHAWDFIMADKPIPDGFDIDAMTPQELDAMKIKPYRTLQDRDFLVSFIGNKWAPSNYGSTSPQEFFAESVRAYCNVNDTGSLWDEISGPKYRCMNRASYTKMTELFLRFNGRKFERERRRIMGMES